MRILSEKGLVVILCTMLLVSAFSLSAAGGGDMKGFPGIPEYPGIDYLWVTAEGEEYRESWEKTLKEEGYIWYSFGKKLEEEYEKDACGVDKKIIDFYKGQLKKRGWKYIGEGIRKHHWTKGKEGVSISFPADCTIEYKHMSSEEAKANTANLKEEEFIKAFVKCIISAQKVYEKQGFKTMGDLEGKVSEIISKEGFDKAEKFAEELRNEAKKTIKTILKPFGISLKRFVEVKSGYGNVIQKYFSEHENEAMENMLGFLAINELD